MSRKALLLNNLCKIGMLSSFPGALALAIATWVGAREIKLPVVLGVTCLISVFLIFLFAYFLNKQNRYVWSSRILPYGTLLIVSVAFLIFGNYLPILIAFFLPISLAIVLLTVREAILILVLTCIDTILISISFQIVPFNPQLTSPYSVLMGQIAISVVVLPTATFLLLIPIDQRKRAEEKLSRQHEQLSVTLRSISDGVIAVDNQDKIILLNPVAETLTGLTATEATGKPVTAILQPLFNKDDLPERLLELPTRVYQNGENIEIEKIPLQTGPNAFGRILSIGIAPTRNLKGEIMGAVIVLRDITERERATADILKSSKLETLGVVAGGIAHDFNNVLAIILGNLSLVKLSFEPGTEQAELLDDSVKATNRAAGLARQLLTFARGGEPVKSVIALPQMLKEATSLPLFGSKIEVKYEIDPDLWLVEGDLGQLSQAIQNLVINSIQAQPAGGNIRIKAKNCPKGENQNLPIKNGKCIEITVQDWGEGIEQENFSRIFEPFFTTRSTSSGLGLAVATSIIQKHGGQITVESEPGIGTTFHIYLPAAELKLAPVSVRSEVNLAAHHQSRHVLIMDDEVAVRNMTGRILKRHGFTVTEAREGSEAVRLYRDALNRGKRFDFVVTDLTVPGGLGGKEIIGDLLTLDPTAQVIVSSGYFSDPVMANYQDYGFAGVLIKPYTIQQLVKIIEQLPNQPANNH